MKVYVAATRQNDGKTIVSLGLISTFLKRGKKVGYIKPVGQHYVEIEGHKVDEDAVLIKETYGIPGALCDMSPVAVPKGFTEKYIKHPDRNLLVNQITDAFSRASEDKNFVLIEGTGHAGVGSVFDMSNADVAAMLGAKVLLVSSGGIGRPIDEIMLNKALFDSMGVKILGAIVNKIQPEKYEKIAPLVRKGLERKGVEVLGVMPHNPVLSSPTMEELFADIKGRLLSGANRLNTVVKRTLVGAMSPHEALRYFDDGTLLITPGTREDMILAALGSFGFGNESCIAGIVLTGGIRPHARIMDLICRSEIPVIGVPDDTFTMATRIDNLVVKVRPGDTPKIAAAEELVSQYLDIDRLMDMLSET